MSVSSRCLLALGLCLPLSACDGSKPAAPQAKADAPAPASPKKDGPAKPTQAHGSGAPHGGGAPHGATPANPHGGGAGPHGGMKPPVKKMGPPREVTPSGEVTPETIAEFKLSVPKEWEKGQPSGMMRIAQWVVPGPGGDAELVVYRFKGGAGGVEDNMARWKKQFEIPQGKTLADLGTTTELTVGTLKISKLDVSGRYVAAVTPGAEEKHDEANYRLLAAIIENSGDPLFLKTVGPAKTLDIWADGFEATLQSLSTEG